MRRKKGTKTKIWPPFSHFLLLSRLKRKTKKQNRRESSQQLTTCPHNFPPQVQNKKFASHSTASGHVFWQVSLFCFTWKRWDKKTRSTFYLVRKHSLIHYLGSLGFRPSSSFYCQDASFSTKISVDAKNYFLKNIATDLHLHTQLVVSLFWERQFSKTVFSSFSFPARRRSVGSWNEHGENREIFETITIWVQATSAGNFLFCHSKRQSADNYTTTTSRKKKNWL